MPSPVDPHVLEPLVEMLVETSDPAARDRLLLDMPRLLGLAPAVALWRFEPARSGARAGWREVLARGPKELLPDATRVAAVARGGQPAELAGHGTVLVAGSAERRRALCLGGLVGDHETIVDLLEALFATYAALEEAWEPAPDPRLAGLAPALPSSGSRIGTGREAQLRHDVRNHLASIRSTRELLERFGMGLSPLECEHFHAVLEREVRRASDLLVQAARPEPSPVARTSTPAAVVGDVVDSERAACEARGIELGWVADAAARDLWIGLSETDVDRILRNLLVNARQALEGGRRAGRIQVCVRARAGALEVEVSDNGPGLDAEALGKLWTEGYTRGKRGSGLGLAVVRELVLSVGGTVHAGSAPGGGARFTLVFPAPGPDGVRKPRNSSSAPSLPDGPD